MVKQQVLSRGITDARVIDVMRRLPRHSFASGHNRSSCYADHPISIGFGQTMSQPFIVALMTEKLRLSGREVVLEIGTGSGYQTAILAELAARVCSIERISALQTRAQQVLYRLGYENILFRTSDGSVGWRDEAPFDRILVAAAAETVPRELVAQLADNGVMLIPVGDIGGYQVLTIIRRCGRRLHTQRSVDCRFVPLRRG